jgi:hypothetical protein
MTLSLRYVWDRFDEMLHGDRYVRASFDLNPENFEVNELETEAERAGLRTGDIVIGVNRRPVEGWSDIEGPLRRARTGDRLLLRVKRMGAAGPVEQEISVPLERFTYLGYTPGSAGYIATLLSRILTPLFCLVLGFWVAAVRVGDRTAWTLLLLMLAVGNLVIDTGTSFGREDALQPFLNVLNGFFIRLGPLALVYFGIVFPERLALDRKFPWIKWIDVEDDSPHDLSGLAGGSSATRAGRDDRCQLDRADARVGLIAIGFALLAGLGAFADRLRRWIDRRFFREASEADEILADLAARVRTMVETGPLLETVASRVAEALHVPRIAIFLDGNGALRPAYAVGYEAPPSAAFNERGLTLRRLRQTPHTLVDFEDADSWVQLTDREERTALEELEPELLLPLSLKEKMLGIMSLGPKQSEEPFSPTDLRLLNLVAAQTGLALENGRLTEAIKAEARAREKQNREL